MPSSGFFSAITQPVESLETRVRGFERGSREFGESRRKISGTNLGGSVGVHVFTAFAYQSKRTSCAYYRRLYISSLVYILYGRERNACSAPLLSTHIFTVQCACKPNQPHFPILSIMPFFSRSIGRSSLCLLALLSRN